PSPTTALCTLSLHDALPISVILRDKSPRATAVATSAMLRTCAVRFPAMKFTLSVRSFHVPATPGTCAWPPSLPSVPTSREGKLRSEEHTSELQSLTNLVCRL